MDLPEILVNSMKTLFDILDEKRTGLIRLSDIEKYWESQDRQLITNLKKIIPKNGLVSFERLCVAIKMSKQSQPQHQSTPPKKPPRLQPKNERLSKMEIMSNLEKWHAFKAPVPDQTFQDLYAQPQRTGNKKPRKDRRHTLQNSIDYTILKQLKQIEFEKDMLMQGYSMVQRAGNWYMTRLKMVDDKLKSVANGNRECMTQIQLERLELQKIRINEVNRSLLTLIENWDRNFPMHINLEIGNQYKGIQRP